MINVEEGVVSVILCTVSIVCDILFYKFNIAYIRMVTKNNKKPEDIAHINSCLGMCIISSSGSTVLSFTGTILVFYWIENRANTQAYSQKIYQLLISKFLRMSSFVVIRESLIKSRNREILKATRNS
jgi:O-antigen/teichoic acid export membrane protein